MFDWVLNTPLKLGGIITQQTHDVVSTSIRRLYDVATSYRRLIDVETTSCVNWERLLGNKRRKKK